MDELVKNEIGFVKFVRITARYIQMDHDETLMLVRALLKLKYSAPVGTPKRPLDYAREALKKKRAQRKAKSDRAKNLHTHMLRYKK